MRRNFRLRSLFFAGFLGGAAVLLSPAAGAQEITEPVVDTTEIIDQVQSGLAALEMATPEVDPAVVDAVDEMLNNTTGVAEDAEPTPAVSEIAAAPYAEEPAPNYHWRNDVAAKAMAGSSADPVLHRVQGSWFDAPDIPAESKAAEERGVSLYGPGTPVFVGDSMVCTLGVAGYDEAGRKVGLTAGHCGNEGDAVISADSWQVGPSGRVVAGNAYHDYSVVEFGDNAEVSNTYNGVTVNSVGGPTPGPGEILCKQGMATGHTCGNTWTANQDVILAQVCAMQGDSGAPVLRGDRMVGMVSGGVLPYYELQCQTPLQGQLFMPTAATNMTGVLADLDANGGPGAGFRPAD